MLISHPDAGSGDAPATFSCGTSGCFFVWIMNNSPRLSDAAIAASTTEDTPQTSTQRILHLLWEAMPFLDAIGDSFRMLADDPADDIAARAAIPAHVKSLLEEAVIEIGELERELLNGRDPAASIATGHSDIVPNVVRDGSTVVYRVRQPEPAGDKVHTESTLPDTRTESEMSLNEVLRGTGVITAQ
ncbi:MAG: hypothetical protein JWQ98_2711 [Chlorobi bacterium]|nr:hypothetical protein [Chlorobiota bacterium]